MRDEVFASEEWMTYVRLRPVNKNAALWPNNDVSRIEIAVAKCVRNWQSAQATQSIFESRAESSEFLPRENCWGHFRLLIHQVSQGVEEWIDQIKQGRDARVSATGF